MSTLDSDGGHDGPGTITLPEKKLIRLRELFRDISVSPGTRLVLLHSLQVLRGNGEWMAIVQPLLRPEMRVFDRMMSGASHDVIYAQPRFVGAVLAALWEEFDDAVDFIQMLLECSHLWGVKWTNTLTKMLSVLERLSAPGISPFEWKKMVRWTRGGRHSGTHRLHRLEGKTFLQLPSGCLFWRPWIDSGIRGHEAHHRDRGIPRGHRWTHTGRGKMAGGNHFLRWGQRKRPTVAAAT